MYQLNPAEIVQGLAAKSIVAAPDQSMKEIAAANSLDPHAIYSVIYILSKQ
jgi:hypothetical protein